MTSIVRSRHKWREKQTFSVLASFALLLSLSSSKSVTTSPPKTENSELYTKESTFGPSCHAEEEWRRVFLLPPSSSSCEERCSTNGPGESTNDACFNMPPYTSQTLEVMPPSPEASSTDLNNNDPIKTQKYYPFTWTPISQEEKMKRREIYYAHGPWCVSPKASMLDLVYSTPGNVLMPRAFTGIAEEIYNFEVRPDDVFVVTYPKCGTTWTQEMVWQILHDVDVEKGQESLMTRSPFLEMESLTEDCDGDTGMDKKAIHGLDTAKALESPRVLKTHLPIDMLPPNLLETAKVVFVARNPMDCCVSFYHHERLVPKQGFSGSFDQYAELFRNGRNPTGDYFYHLKSGWNRRDHPNLKFIWYEDMKYDLRSIIRDMCDFLDHPLSQDKIRALQDHLHIDNFRKNKAVNMETNYGKRSRGQFVRKGSVGGWKGYFSQERIEDWKTWVQDNTKDTGLEFCLD